MTDDEIAGIKTDLKAEIQSAFNQLAALMDAKIDGLKALMVADTIKRGCHERFLRIEDDARRRAEALAELKADVRVAAMRVSIIIGIATFAASAAISVLVPLLRH